MRNAVLGLIIGIVAGIVLGATVIAPRMSATESAILRLPDRPAPDAAQANVETQQDTDTAQEDRSSARRQLRMASKYPAALPAFGAAAVRLERELWRASMGSVDLRFYPPDALIDNDDAVDALASGAIDAFFTDLDSLSDAQPAMTLFAGPPFGRSVAAYLGWMAGRGGELFNETLAEMRLHGVLCGMVPHAGGGIFRSPVPTADALSALRIRATGVEAKMLSRLGADIADFPLTDTQVALESGGLDGAQLSAPHVDVALGADLPGAAYYVPGWRTPAKVFAVLFGKDLWGTLDSAEKTLINTVCGDNMRHAIAEGEALQFNALKKMVAGGTDVLPWPAEVTEAMRDAWAAEADEGSSQDPMYAKALASYRDYIKGQSIWEELARPE